VIPTGGNFRAGILRQDDAHAPRHRQRAKGRRAGGFH
jgi:hypothetical protein